MLPRLAPKKDHFRKNYSLLYLNTFFTGQCHRVRATWMARAMLPNHTGDREYIGRHLMFNETSEISKVTWTDTPGVP